MTRKKRPQGPKIRSEMALGRYQLVATKYHPVSESHKRLTILEWTVFHGSMILGVVRQETPLRYVATWPDGTSPVVAEDPRSAARKLLGG